MSFIQSLFSQPLDQTITQWVALYGPWALGIVALLIFAETGLVVLPFLPGDSLLFITGTVMAAASLNVHIAVGCIALAAVLGDALNFEIGRHAAPRLLRLGSGRWLRQSHLDAARDYFARFGNSTIVIARFVPIVRTMAPFVAGASGMPYMRFAIYNIVGGIAWVAGLTYAGAYFGSQAVVREHLSLITLGIVVLSVVPVVIAAVRTRKRS